MYITKMLPSGTRRKPYVNKRPTYVTPVNAF